MFDRITEKQFWLGISILLKNYHSVNKKISSCIVLKILKTLKNSTNGGIVINATELQGVLQNFISPTNSNIENFTIFYKLLPKKSTLGNIEAHGFIDFENIRYICKFSSNDFDDFSLQLRNGHVIVEILTERLNAAASKRWSEYVFKPKFCNWCNSTSKHKDCIKSLQLVDEEKYNNLYIELKYKFASEALKFWENTKESTDPLKFIYEDLAIAAYLISLWQANDAEPKAFADLGCGNGLLVFILNEMGYKGYGYDIRTRKLWSQYPKEVQTLLIEEPVDPVAFKFPDDVDWLIGNHSDELSPWLPVLAANTNYNMRYFLLPCCAYEFSGAKFQRRNSNLSGYQDFLNYAESISEKCGFATIRDRLKIPSTKRIALLGLQRIYAECEYLEKRKELAEFVRLERQLHPSGEIEVKLREKHEAVRNCTQIEKCVLDTLIEKIFHRLLSASQADPTQNWHRGGRLKILEIIKGLSKEDLQHIKSECGGIKTLLKNKHEIFEFCGNDLIGIRKPQVKKTTTKPQTTKKRDCFFKLHHPEGCPLNDEQCTFLH